MKRCTRCGEEKSEGDFYRRENGKLYARCKRCHNVLKQQRPRCLKCGTRLRRGAEIDLCGFCAPDPPPEVAPEEFVPPAPADNRARVAADRASARPSNRKGPV